MPSRKRRVHSVSGRHHKSIWPLLNSMWTLLVYCKQLSSWIFLNYFGHVAVWWLRTLYVVFPARYISIFAYLRNALNPSSLNDPNSVVIPRHIPEWMIDGTVGVIWEKVNVCVYHCLKHALASSIVHFVQHITKSTNKCLLSKQFQVGWNFEQ